MKIFTVSQINKIIKDLIDNEIILEDVAVTGELSSFSVTRGIAYFTIKDNENMLSCVQFGASQEFKIGDMVECRGNVKYYPKGGKLSLNVIKISLCGQGELYQQFLALKEKLGNEGLFDDINKIPLPRFINSIGVVTSATGAVLQDIRNVTSRRNPNLDIYVYDAQVQGKYAVDQVIEGIMYFDNYTDVDVIVVARGGGSIEDLAPFNDERLARIAYICNKPLISAVGHETDFSILDFVADLRAPTPSAAAELVTFDSKDMIRYVKETLQSIEQITTQKLQTLEATSQMSIISIEKHTNDIVADQILHINDLLNVCDKSVENKLNATTHNVELMLNTLDKLSPTKLLQKGYSFVTVAGKPVEFKNTEIGDQIEIVAKDVKMEAKITNKEKLC